MSKLQCVRDNYQFDSQLYTKHSGNNTLEYLIYSYIERIVVSK
jgi:hypothetical protein